MGKIFISYAREDKDAALELYRAFDELGFSSWIDENDLLPGQEWKAEIEKAIRESDVFIACLSNNSVSKRGFVQAELKKALTVAETIPEGEIYIIPVRLDECKVPSSLSNIHWVDYFKSGEKEKLLKAIRSRVKTSKQAKTEKVEDKRTEVEQEKYYDAGARVKTVRTELGINTSQFVEALDLASQREYETMENQERELPLSLLKRVSNVSGVNLNWLKHGEGRKYTIEYIHLNPIEDGLEFCASLHPQEYYLTFDKKQLHIGLVAQTSKYCFQVLDTGITLDFWNWVESHWIIPRFYHFLERLSSPWQKDIESFFLPTRDDKQLFEGDVHFLAAMRNSDGPAPGFIYDLLDLDHARLSRRPHSKTYGISSMDKIQDYFREYLQKEKNIHKASEPANSESAMSAVVLKDELTQVLKGTYDAARKRGYVATYFLQMLEEHDGVETAKKLLSKSEPQTGLFELWERGLLNESLEAVVLRDKFQELFTKDELAEATRRLDELGYFKKGK